jgi:dihydroneopterin aldolase
VNKSADDGAAGFIKLTGLEVFAFHGVLPSEKEQGQLFLIDLELGLDLSTAGHSDRLEDTIDYGALARAVHDRVATERWDLLERVAHRVAELVMELPTVEQVAVTIHKPEAPIPLGFADVAVTVRLQR